MKDKAFDTPWQRVRRADAASLQLPHVSAPFERERPPAVPIDAGGAPKREQGSEKESDAGRERPAEPPAPGPEQAPHEHPDDPGVHPDGPRRYHDDHATPARQSAEEGVPA
jgi:hypothetical protein